MGLEYPFLPGADYFTNFKTGDPFTKVQEGEIRLPGKGYERMNRLYGDASSRYGPVTQFDILADVAPYSQQFKQINSALDKMQLSPDEKIRVEQIRKQVGTTTKKYEFTPYESAKDYLPNSIGKMQRL